MTTNAEQIKIAAEAERKLKCCPVCGMAVKFVEIGGKSRFACTVCEFVHWNNPRPVTATLVPMDGGLVLVKRSMEPFVGHWCLPGGFIETAEHPELGAIREVEEETGLKVEIERLLHAGAPGDNINVVVLFYLARAVSGTPALKPGDDADEARVFKFNELPENIAFRLHQKMVQLFFEHADGLRNLRLEGLL
jgi:8-oxo-dGTP diphosphatase